MIHHFKKIFLVVAFLTMILGGTHYASAASIVVDSNLDNTTASDGNCTLREAIENANNDSDTTSGDCVAGSGTDTITFSGGMTIQILTGLSITSPVILDGTSAGATGTCATKSLGVVLDGSLGVTLTAIGISSGGDGSTIKGLVIQNMGDGVGILSADNVSVQCNIFGLNQAGTALAENSNTGIHITSAIGTLIGGLNSGDGNIISGNNTGISVVDSSDTDIFGNNIGLNLDGDGDFDAQNRGIYISGSNGVTIGGSTVAHRNVISGSRSEEFSTGMSIDGISSDITIQGNYFGTDSSGLINIPSSNENVSLCGADGCGLDTPTVISNVVIGGANSGEGNIFGATSLYNNVKIYEAGTSNVSIRGNQFGVGSDGTTLIGTSQTWIHSIGVDTLNIGGANSGEGNVFAANDSSGGMSVEGGSDVTVSGNMIGVLSDGVTTTGIFDGIAVKFNEVNGVTFGEAVAGGRNIVIGTFDDSLVVFNSVQNATIYNNRIGIDSEGSVVVSGSSIGLLLTGTSGIVGGTGVNEPNVITGFESVGIFAVVSSVEITGNVIYGGNTGVVVSGTILAPGDTSSSLLQNAIYDNAFGIDIAYDTTGDVFPNTNLGPTPNDPGDADTGPNDYLNTPIIHSVDTTTGLITYSVDVPAGDYRIEFFTGDAVGQAETYVGYDTFVSTGAEKQQTVTLALNPGDIVSATTTQDLGEGYGATSELSQAYEPIITPSRSTRVIGGRVTNEYLAQHNITLASAPTTDTPATCPANQILTQNLKAGARNGKYHAYTKAIVTEVKILQAHMNRLGFKSGPEDGILGPITDGAIKRMQTFLGTKPDGYVGPITRSLINKSCGSGGLQKS